jgi:hypothetical protein
MMSQHLCQISMRNLPILSMTILLLCGAGSGCMAAPQTKAQSSPKPVPANGSQRPPATPKTPKSSPFVPGVSLPVFPGTVPAATSAPTPEPTTPALPLVEVTTPGLRSSKGKKSSNQPAPPLKQRQKAVEETPSPVRQRSKRRES